MDKIKQLKSLQEQVSRLQCQIYEEQKNCQHVWGEDVYSPIKKPTFAYSHLEGHGSDPYPIYIPSGFDETPQWTRTCQKCGLVESTTKTKVVSVKPQF